MFSFGGNLKDIRYFNSNLTLVRSYHVLAPGKKIPIFELSSMTIMSLGVIFEEACIKTLKHFYVGDAMFQIIFYCL